MTFRTIFGAAVLLGGVGLGAAQAEIASHRAAYTLSLGQAKTSSGITSISGAMIIDWQESCEGWTLSQRMRFQLADGEGSAIDTDLIFSSWEASDGLGYRFTMRTVRDGELAEELRGRAELDGPDKGGKATFTIPAGTVMSLPAGTMFPTVHTLLLIERARAGEVTLSRVVFDGSDADGPLEVNAIIGPKVTPPKIDSPKIAPIANRPGWRVRMAFFKPSSNSGEPDYETGMLLLDNGVARDFTFEYSDFSIKAKLDRLEALPKPKC